MAPLGNQLLAEQYLAILGDSDADMELLVGPEEHVIAAHHIVLKARSPFFRAMFASEMKESRSTKVRLPLFDARAWKLLLPFIYGGCCEQLDLSDLQAVTQLAEFLQLHDFPEYLHKDLRVKTSLKTFWRAVEKQGSERAIRWLAEIVRSPTLRAEVEQVLISAAKKDGKTLRMLWIAKHFGFPELETVCFKEFSKLFLRCRRCMEDSDSEEEGWTAAEKLDKDMDMGDWQFHGLLLDVYITSCNEALAAVISGISDTLSDEPLDNSQQFHLKDLLTCVSRHNGLIAELASRELPQKAKSGYREAAGDGRANGSCQC